MGLRHGIFLMNGALEEVYHAMGTFPQGSASTSQWVLRMSQQLHDLLEGCNFIERRAQLHAAHGMMRKDSARKDGKKSDERKDEKVEPSSAEYVGINHDVMSGRLQAQSLLEAIQRRRMDEPGVMTRWFPFITCCATRSVLRL